MKRWLLISLMVILSSLTYAAISGNYKISPDNIGSGGDKKTSSSNIEINSAGEAAWGINYSTNFLHYGGFISALVGAGDIIPPSIGQVKFDGSEIVSGDYIKKDAILTAIVLDIGAMISREASRITVDDRSMAFSALSAPSSYDPLTGALTYKLDNLADGDHTISITAYDTNDNHSTYSRSAKVAASEYKTANAYIYPNPFNPVAGPARIAYELSQDMDLILYLFNEVNQPVWKKVIASGAAGGKAGYNEVEWSGITDFGDLAGNGIYFLRITTGGRVLGKIKIAVLK